MKEIGKVLKEKRVEKGLDFETIHKATRIQQKYLTAIEDGDINVFSAEIYYKTFMKAYAKYLGFDPEILARQYEDRKCSDESLEEQEESFTAPGKHTEKKKDKPAGCKEDARKPMDTKKLLITIFIALCLLGIFVYMNKNIDALVDKNVDINLVTGEAEAAVGNERAEKPKQTAETPAEAAVQASQPLRTNTIAAAAVSAVQNTNKAPAATATRTPSVQTQRREESVRTQKPARQELTIEAVENVWIRVEADGREMFQGTVVKGDTKRWRADEVFTLKIGYTPGVKVTFNNQPVDIIKGSVQDVNTVVLRRQQ